MGQKHCLQVLAAALIPPYALHLMHIPHHQTSIVAIQNRADIIEQMRLLGNRTGDVNLLILVSVFVFSLQSSHHSTFGRY